MTHVQLCDLRPAFPGASGQPLPHGVLGRLGEAGCHRPIVTAEHRDSRAPLPGPGDRPSAAGDEWSRRVAAAEVGAGADNPAMPVTSPFVIVLTAAEEAVLTVRACSGRTEHRDRMRARIVLAAAGGASNAAIAAQLGVCVD